jgi:hypothetical protein
MMQFLNEWRQWAESLDEGGGTYWHSPDAFEQGMLMLRIESENLEGSPDLWVGAFTHALKTGAKRTDDEMQRMPFDYFLWDLREEIDDLGFYEAYDLPASAAKTAARNLRFQFDAETYKRHYKNVPYLDKKEQQSLGLTRKDLMQKIDEYVSSKDPWYIADMYFANYYQYAEAFKEAQDRFEEVIVQRVASYENIDEPFPPELKDEWLRRMAQELQDEYELDVPLEV